MKVGEGTLEWIHVARVKHGAPEAIEEAALRPGRGVPGDHRDKSGVRRAVTLIRAETVERVCETLGKQAVPGMSRRNLTVRGFDLDALVAGTRLVVGEVELEVRGPCDPCRKMEVAIGKGALVAMAGKGGLVAKVVRAGRIRRGDAVRIPAENKLDSNERASALHGPLLAWFRRDQRDLPWRRTRDPYAIWISEVMLQQTQVATVIPYFERFLARFPSVRALAEAPVDDVLAHWSGLGYYARARNLHRAAQAIVERHGGALPADLQALRALPGFGPYTAGAVGSIALGLDAPLVDGNVARVFCRLEGWEVGAEKALEQAWEHAPALVAKGEAGDWNQALMELGATVCTPANPRCDACPVQAACVSAHRGEPAKYPLPKVRAPRKLLRLAALVVREGGAVVLEQREKKGLFGGLWQPPTVELSLEAEALPAARDAARRLVGPGATVERIGLVEQTLTHREVTVEVFAVTGGTLAPPPEARLVTPEMLGELGLSTLVRRVLAAARAAPPAPRQRPAAAQGRLF